MLTGKTQNYIDIDLSFQKHPGTKDIRKKYDHEAVKQSLKNLLLSSKWDKPFDPDYGAGLKDWLFEQNHISDSILAAVVERKILEVITQYEPRVIVNQLIVSSPPDSHNLEITLVFSTQMNKELTPLAFTFKRVR